MKALSRYLIIFIMSAGFLPPIQALAKFESGTYKVKRVKDGDTVVLESIGDVRLIGVDTPETKDPRKPVQYFGKEASDYLKSKVQGKKVKAECDAGKKDKYRRSLCYLYTEAGEFVNRAIIADGYGFVETRFPFEHMEDFRKAQAEARESSKGLWADPTRIGEPANAPALKTKNKPGASVRSCEKKTCSQITDCAEAMRLLSHCGMSRLDRDSDGVPCEKLCKLVSVRKG